MRRSNGQTTKEKCLLVASLLVACVKLLELRERGVAIDMPHFLFLVYSEFM